MRVENTKRKRERRGPKASEWSSGERVVEGNGDDRAGVMGEDNDEERLGRVSA